MAFSTHFWFTHLLLTARGYAATRSIDIETKCGPKDLVTNRNVEEGSAPVSAGIAIHNVANLF